jgi:hypothetical protein
MIASGSWYTSGVLWTAVGAIAVVIIGLLTMLVTWWIGVPRRSLLYTIPVAASLLSSHVPGPARPDLEIRYRGGRALDDPHLVSLRVVSKSLRDIRSTEFDNRQPLVFDLGRHIVVPLDFRFDRKVAKHPEWLRIEDSQIKIGPTLIRRRQELQIDVMTEGPPNLTVTSPIADVKVREQSREQQLEKWWSITAIVLLVVGLATLVGLALAGVLHLHPKYGF